MRILNKATAVNVVRYLRNDKTRMHIGAVFIVLGLVLFGMYFPQIRVQAPNEAALQADGTGAADVAGANTKAANEAAEKGEYPRTHAGAPAEGQRVASIPGSDKAACAAGTSAGKTSAPAGLSGTIDVTIPQGCSTSGTYEVRTSDGREVQWAPLYGAFTFKDGSSYNQRAGSAYAVNNLQFNPDSHKGASIRYGVTAKTTAKPGTYENALYVTDAAHKDGGYKVILRITVK